MRILKFNITGMTCEGCVTSVRKGLESMDGVTKVEVSLETGSARLEAERSLSVDDVQAAIPSAYAVAAETAGPRQGSVKPPTKLRQLMPLFLAFGLIALLAGLLPLWLGGGRSYMLDFMGLFYLVFSALKFVDYSGFPQSFRMYDPLAARWEAYAWAYPFIELLLGVLLLSGTGVPYALGLTLLILGATTTGVLHSLSSKRSIRCACMGTALRLPMTEATLIENLLMIGMAIAYLWKAVG